MKREIKNLTTKSTLLAFLFGIGLGIHFVPVSTAAANQTKEDRLLAEKLKAFQSSYKKEKRGQRRDHQKQAEVLYKEARELYKSKLYEQSKEKLENLTQFLLDHRVSSRFMDKINRKIAKLYGQIGKGIAKRQAHLQKEQEKRDKELMENKRKEEQLARQRQLEDEKKQEQIDKERKLKMQRNAEYKRKELQKEVKVRQDQLKDSQVQLKREFNMGVDSLYRRAVGLHKEKKYTHAKELFQDINQLYPKYKNTSQYLNRIDRDIQNEQKSRKKRKAVKQKQSRKRLISEALDKF